ncbi:type II CAAX prenyl endopeptidase Rce1 family protein [Prosthecobacter fluviatilis]|uniref:Type II CAAX prenyl endopeptidase Rce1 family protein n=1 Tax=Prosthecobacter fluviatilis TaxID=445931 RepID=A0ABW0KPJ0_9BACT
MQAASPGSSPALPKLLLYLLAVMLGGALLSVPLFHLGKAAHGWLSASSLHDTGPVRWLLAEIERAQFTRYFNRAVLVCAILFIWPFMRWVRLERSLLPAWGPFGRGFRQWGVGFLLAAGLLLALGFIFLKMGAYQLRPDPRWWKLGEPVTAALGAGLVEEFFFRGLLLGLLLRSMKEPRALLALTFVFALVHFLKPPEGWQISDAAVTWSSGFLVLKQIAAGFGDVHFLLAEFATLFAVGWVLAKARMQTGALWAGMGLHGGWVFGLKYFSALTTYSGHWLPWIGANLKVGLMPLCTVLLTGWAATRLLRAR